ncbi:hypothetical protein FEQ05_00852 [Burkholderia pseudomultivorans]|uniref:SET domain-containing protein-lysine N-methyltransferase n=1 Tax=Burkholderia pseudomultivorans TaxID=1207504 RepID=A0ABU2E1E3_9BURK|nr:hypothetical protein [Burkholderia pseudomultivorans]MDR8735223.1 hypothetical protein [Burkholderia pseudomultivorans]MDR8741401.1 hypothetical protein [Burkholderia pseudomultivorans]MDR8753645.1 hypothetical protein [Burkholderia pseudomultivorans]MDR8777815.1 hypothetical protein [Burkholderia pseudomultivorans]
MPGSERTRRDRPVKASAGMLRSRFRFARSRLPTFIPLAPIIRRRQSVRQSCFRPSLPSVLVADLTSASPVSSLKRSPATPSRSRITVRRSSVHGRGVFATRGFPVGALICEYKGERIGWDEAMRRHPRDPDHPDHTFYFDVGDGTVIDGGVGGNSARWLNHSCQPNCEAEDHDERIFIRTIRAIQPGEELSIDYALVVDGRHTRQLRERFACRCGSPVCRGTMLAVRRRARQKTGVVAQLPADTPSDATGQTQRTVRVFERPNADSLIVAWREAGRCCYSEQRWVRAQASAAGVCALSGNAFVAGQMVFKPLHINPAPVNHDACIAECSVPHLPEFAEAPTD